ncbi:hypothetical protein NC652_002745 [Populus alba x Populus x berolinensis]|nr:hypothetical protein NC652_002745 [Populus alba x Populus x berolinensis]
MLAAVKEVISNCCAGAAEAAGSYSSHYCWKTLVAVRLDLEARSVWRTYEGMAAMGCCVSNGVTGAGGVAVTDGRPQCRRDNIAGKRGFHYCCQEKLRDAAEEG